MKIGFTASVLATALAASTALADDIQIVQKDKSFSTTEVTAKVGDKIVFDNQDAITHNIYSKDTGNEFEFAKQEPGQKESYTIKSPGKITVHCALHPKMKLVVNVQ